MTKNTKSELKNLPIDTLVRGEYQPRVHFEADSLKELASSIQAQGLIEPLVVRPVTSTTFEIIAGERRWRAAQLIGLETLPCLINDYSDEQAVAVSLIENIQREDLNSIEEASGYHRLIKEFYFQHDDIAKMVGKSRSYITNMLRLLTLDEQVKKALIEKRLTMGQTKILVGLDSNIQQDLMHKIIKNEWSARRVESEVKKIKQVNHSPKQDRDVERLEQLISEQLGSSAEIQTDQGESGWLKIKFYNNDTLAGLLDKMGVNYDGS